METFELIVIAAVAAGALLVLLMLFGMWRRRRRRDRLQERFGPEYDRTVSAEGRRSPATCRSRLALVLLEQSIELQFDKTTSGF